MVSIIYMSYSAALFMALFGVASAGSDSFIAESCMGLYVTIWEAAGGSPPQTYVTNSEIYSLATPNQTPDDSVTIAAGTENSTPALTFAPTTPAEHIQSAIYTSTQSQSPSPEPTRLIHTQNGFCATNGATCQGWPLGECCSQYSSCGNTTDYCGSGCQSDYGICGIQSAEALPSSVLVAVSTPDIFSSAVSSPTPTPAFCPPENIIATFYSEDNFLGNSYEACGSLGVCQNVPVNFDQGANSVVLALATESCVLFSLPGCDTIPVGASSVTLFRGQQETSDFSTISFNDTMASYICYSGCPPGKRSPSC